MDNLDIGKTLASNIASSDNTHPVFYAIKKYEYHPIIKRIKHPVGGKDLQFSFIFETKSKILAEFHNIHNKKACQKSDIPVKIIKDNIDIFSEIIFHNFSNSIFDATFPSEFKNADVMESFLSNTQQRTKINNGFSRYSEIIYGVPQGSILIPLLFNI